MKRVPTSCPAELTLQVVGGRWKIIIVWFLLKGTLRYSDLSRSMKGISHKMLSQQLRELERDGLLERTIHNQVPPKVEYTLTALGRSLQPVVDAMHRWGVREAERSP